MALQWNDKAFRDRVKKAAMKGIVEATEAIREEAVSLIMNPPKTGRIYRRRGVFHQASASGEAPANNTGQLANSITTEYDANKLTGSVVVRSQYGFYLEFGTQTIEPRPFLRPAIANKRKEIEAVVKGTISAEFK